MASILSQVLMAGALAIGCQTYAQSGPNLVVDGKVIAFDKKYVTPIDEESRQGVLGKVHQIIDRSLNQGVNKVGAVDLRQLRREVGTVKMVVVNFGALAVGVGPFSARLGSVYFAETKTLFLNQQILTLEARAWPMLIHEFLGALGYNDENYQISSILLSENTKKMASYFNSSKDLGKKLANTPKQKLQNLGDGKALSSGGTTVVGGGGDEILLAAKTYMMDRFEFWKTEMLPLFLKDPTVGAEIESTFSRGDLEKLQRPDILDAYLRYFVKTPFEPMTTKDQVPKGPISNANDIARISGIFSNERSTAYVRLSRDHWDMSIAHLTVEQSRQVIMTSVHFHLFMSFVRDGLYK